MVMPLFQMLISANALFDKLSANVNVVIPAYRITYIIITKPSARLCFPFVSGNYVLHMY